MRIAVNTRFLLEDKLEGIGWYTHEIVRRMVRDHPDDEFFFLFDRPFNEKFLFGENVKPIVLFPPARHPVLWYVWFEYAVNRALKRINADVFFSPDGYLSLHNKTRTVMVMHDISYMHFPDQVSKLVYNYYNYFVPRYLERADKILTVSKFSRQDILTHFTIEPGKISVTYNGCREEFRPMNSADILSFRNKNSGGEPFFLFVGAIHPRKNVEGLIRAFDIYKNRSGSQIRLLIYGRMAWKTKAVEDIRNTSPFSDHIRIVENVSQKDLTKAYGAAFAFILPSPFEGFGIPILEAFHSNTPVITSNISPMHIQLEYEHQLQEYLSS